MPTVLIVDDEQHIRLLIEQTLEELEDEGVELLTAADGEEALIVVANQHPDLVFLDVMMPRQNGFEVCRVIKQPIRHGRDVRDPADRQGPGLRSRAGHGGGGGPVHDQAVRPRRAAAARAGRPAGAE